MLWFALILAITTIILVIKIAQQSRAMDRLRQDINERSDIETNTLLSVSGGGAALRRLADVINDQLRGLRAERQKLQSGNAELSDATTNISHDLRTPLTAICGYLDLLEQEEKSEDAARYLGYIRERTEILTGLTDELFAYTLSISSELGRENIHLNRAIEESVAAHYAAFNERGITPSITIPERKIARQLNKVAIARIFGNILSNAIKYSDGDLDITLHETGEIVFSNMAASLDEVQVGMLFNRFYTVDSGRKSTGLGLSIARSLTEAMGGMISATYNEGRLCISLLFDYDC